MKLLTLIFLCNGVLAVVCSTYLDWMAQSTCVGLSRSHNIAGHIAAVRRRCNNASPSCASVCQKIVGGPNVQAKPWRCFDSLHVYKQPANKLNNNVDNYNDVGRVGPYMYRYNGCGGSYCGPNYCCCTN